MLNKVLWAIDNNLDAKAFECLCIDLLYRNGYRDIVPIEPQDGGRDAEELPRLGRSRAGEVTFFQFSLEKSWRAKARRDARKVSGRGYLISSFVVVTSQKARGVDVDSLKSEFRRKYHWGLLVFSRAWLRLQLEEAHPDLAKKYLGVDVTGSSEHLSALLHFSRPTSERQEDAWKAFRAGRYDRAAAEFKEILDEQPEDSQAWQALAWCQYSSWHYDEALQSVGQALKLKPEPQATLIRACILAEKGIKEGRKALVLEAKSEFELLADSGKEPSWTLPYNLGNVLAALGNYDEAIVRYRQAADMNPTEPSIWKNLASAYHRAGDHKSEMQCFDSALELDPTKPEALISKGVSMLLDFDRPQDAASLIEDGMRYGRDLLVHWPHTWFWLGEAHRRSGKSQRALEVVNDGLSMMPGDAALRRLKSRIFAGMAECNDLTVAEEARAFWTSRLAEEAKDYDVRSQLVRLEAATGKVDVAWGLLDACFPLVGLGAAAPMRASGFELRECVDAFEFLPQYRVFRGRFKLTDYWSRDALSLGPHDVSRLPRFGSALNTYLSVPFGLGMSHMERRSKPGGKDEDLHGFFDVIRAKIQHVLTESARELASLVPSHEASTELIAARLADVGTFLGFVALLEFARQRGFVAGLFHVPTQVIDAAAESYDERQIEADVVSASVAILYEPVWRNRTKGPQAT